MHYDQPTPIQPVPLDLPAPSRLPGVKTKTGRTIANLLGRTYGKLTVTGFAGTDARGNTVWTCRCECGNDCAAPAAVLNAGLKTQCPECGRKNRRRKPKEIPAPPPRRTAAILRSLRALKRNDTLRGVEWNLADDDAAALMSSDCHWCGAPPAVPTPDPEFLRNGLDRLLRQFGHSTGNSVPCCPECARMKGELSASAFLDRISAIHANRLS